MEFSGLVFNVATSQLADRIPRQFLDQTSGIVYAAGHQYFTSTTITGSPIFWPKTDI
jgi:hypothetical protein